MEDNPGCGKLSFRVVLGCYHTPEEFVCKALQAVHPFDRLDVLPDVLKTRLFQALTKGPVWVQETRVAVLKKWLAWAKECDPAEKSMRDGLDSGVRKVLTGKRLCLLERLAASIGWCDMQVFADLRKGFDIVGAQPYTNVFERDIRPASLTLRELHDTFKFMRPALIGKIQSHPPCEHDAELWQKTLDEVAAGNLEGPLPESKVRAMHGSDWVPVRRFGVVQSSAGHRKLRPVDDFSENKVNCAFGSSDKLDLRTLDEFAAACRLWARAVMQGHVSITMSDGRVLEGKVHGAWSVAGGSRPLITTLDLKAAYKQIPLAPSSRPLAVVSLPHPESREPAFFTSCALPFGASASVLHFNRVSRLLWRLGLELLLFWSNYFDDYPVMSPELLASATRETMLSFMKLIGFQCAEDKLSDFSAKAVVLGIEIDCSRSEEGLLLISNKQGRAEEVCEALQGFLAAGSMSRKDFARLMGRLQFADAQVMGKSGRLAMSDVRRWAKAYDQPTLFLLGPAVEAYRVLIQRLKVGTPRLVPCCMAERVWHVFTDGASEGMSNTVGGVLHRSGDITVRFFACHVSRAVVSEWSKDLKHVIGPVEAYAVSAARLLWHQHLAGQHVVFHVDNYGAMDAFVKGSSASKHIRDILLAFEKCESTHPTWPWFSRVPSASNCADDPSRGVLDKFVGETFLRERCLCPLTRVFLEDLTS